MGQAETLDLEVCPSNGPLTWVSISCWKVLVSTPSDVSTSQVFSEDPMETLVGGMSTVFRNSEEPRGHFCCDFDGGCMKLFLLGGYLGAWTSA